MALVLDGQLQYSSGGATPDNLVGHVNSDASSPGQEPPTSVSAATIGFDLAAGYYFVTNNDHLTISSYRMSDNAPISTVQIGRDLNTADGHDDDIVNALAVDPTTHTLYVGDWGQDTTHTGIVTVTYDPSTGVLATNSAVNPNGTAGNDAYNPAATYLLTNASTNGAFNDARDFSIDTTHHLLYWTDNANNTNYFGATNGIYVVDYTNPSSTLRELTSNANATGGFPTDETRGYVSSLTIDTQLGLVYFETHTATVSGGASGNPATLWYVSATGSNNTAVQVSLPGGTQLGTGDQPPGGLAIDEATQQLYVTVQSDKSATIPFNGPDEVLQFQLSADGHSATLLHTYPIATLDGHTPDTNAHIQDLAFDQLPTLGTLSPTVVHAVEQSTSVTLLTAAPSITDTDQTNLASATVQITGGTFSRPASNENSTSDDHLSELSSALSGTNITATYNSTTETLTLSGDDTLAHYQQALAGVQYNTTGDNPTNYGNNASRTLTFQVNDGAFGNPAGATNVQTMSVNIDATNDAPSFTPTNVNLTETNSGLNQATNTTITDPDSLSQTITTSYVSETGPTNGISTTMLAGYFSAGTPVATPPPGTTGTLTYTFNSGTQAFNYLRANQQLAVTYNINDADSADTGTSAPIDRQVVVTITGTNDPASITAVTNPANFTEAGNASAQTLSGSGSLAVNDLDVGDTFTASVTGNGTASLDNGSVSLTPYASNIANLLSSSDLVFTTGVLSNGSTQAINFTYNSAAANLDFLNSTDHLTVTFQAQVNDGTGTSSTQPITITIDGTNDAPTITSGNGATASYNVPENTTALTTVTATDVDEGDTPTYSILSDTGTDYNAFTINSSTGALSFTSAPDYENPSHTTFGSTQTGNTYVVDVQASDGHPGGTATQAITVNVMNVNEAPAGTNNTVTTNEDTAYSFTTSDFGFTDPNDIPPNSLNAVEITTLPSAGTLTDNGSAVNRGDFVSATDISSGLLRFTPAPDANGTGYASFTFQVQDNGGAASGGVDTDPTPNTMTVNVTAVNDPPSFTGGPDETVLEDSGVAQFLNWATNISTGPVNEAGQTVHFNVTGDTNPGLFNAGPAITPNGTLSFTPAPNANGSATITVTAQDDGGTANSGQDTSAPQSFTITLSSVNDAPTTSGNTVRTAEDRPHTFQVSDFPFSDPNDSPPDTLLNVIIRTLPTAGTLSYNGNALTAADVASGGFVVSASDIAANSLVFTPDHDGYGTGYATFNFEVQDSGGTANNGQDTSTDATMAINVTRSVAHDDFNGDGTSDLLWRDSAGNVAEWTMNGGTPTSSALIGGSSTWSVVGTGDFNGDGNTDLLWRDSSSGSVVEWDMDGSTVLSSGVIGGDNDWLIAGTGDFNGDGKTDLLWQQASTGTVVEWDMNDRTVLSSDALGGDSNWSVVGTGDFNGDGETDLLWQEASTHSVTEWQMNDRAVQSSTVLGSGADWQVAGTGDFNGDRESDLLWRQGSDGALVEWQMNGSSIQSSHALSAGTGWDVAGTGDFNGDGMSDILMHNLAGGQVFDWQMNGNTITSSTLLGGDTNWSVVKT